jgi:hypothetical protein
MHSQRDKTITSLVPAARLSADAYSTGVDISRMIGEVAVHESVSAVSGVVPTLQTTIQESDDNTSFTDVTGGAFTARAAANAEETIYLDTRALKKYIRVESDVDGTAPIYDQAVTMFGRKEVGGA